jgi:UDPglucose 6-dehydrogenase
MKITIIGTGYVGLVSGVCYSEIRHQVTCIDIDKTKIKLLRQGISPIYEPDLEQLMRKNIESGRLSFTSDYTDGLKDADVIYIAVGTPSMEDGRADLQYVENAAFSIAQHINRYSVIVIKSTVPVGTNEHVKKIIKGNLRNNFDFDMASNPEFLREGSAVHDTFNGDRIILGSETLRATTILEELHLPLNIPIFHTDIRSAEMIKYASNAFLATKISFINEIANICEKTGANVQEVASGMGMDKRIGNLFLNAGIGYGGSCFPKDTKALVQIAGNVAHDFRLLKSVIEVNSHQQMVLVEKAKSILGDLSGKRIAILGLAFKPNTDDMREAASIVIIERLINEGANVIAYDPISIPNAKKLLDSKVKYGDSVLNTVTDADCILILTDWDEFKRMDLSKVREVVNDPVIFDGRNCLNIDLVKESGFDYFSIGRGSIRRYNPVPHTN